MKKWLSMLLVLILVCASFFLHNYVITKQTNIVLKYKSYEVTKKHYDATYESVSDIKTIYNLTNEEALYLIKNQSNFKVVTLKLYAYINKKDVECNFIKVSLPQKIKNKKEIYCRNCFEKNLKAPILNEKSQIINLDVLIYDKSDIEKIFDSLELNINYYAKKALININKSQQIKI